MINQLSGAGGFRQSYGAGGFGGLSSFGGVSSFNSTTGTTGLSGTNGATGVGGPPPGGRPSHEEKIQELLQSGQMTESDAASLQAPLAEMKQFKASAEADGQISEQEHAQLKSYGDNMKAMIDQFAQGSGTTQSTTQAF